MKPRDASLVPQVEKLPNTVRAFPKQAGRNYAVYFEFKIIRMPLRPAPSNKLSSDTFSDAYERSMPVFSNLFNNFRQIFYARWWSKNFHTHHNCPSVILHLNGAFPQSGAGCKGR